MDAGGFWLSYLSAWLQGRPLPRELEGERMKLHRVQIVSLKITTANHTVIDFGGDVIGLEMLVHQELDKPAPVVWATLPEALREQVRDVQPPLQLPLTTEKDAEAVLTVDTSWAVSTAPDTLPSTVLRLQQGEVIADEFSSAKPHDRL